MCRLNCVGVEKSEYINVGVKKWLKKTAFRCKKVEAKKGYLNFHQCTLPDFDTKEKGIMWLETINGRIAF